MNEPCGCYYGGDCTKTTLCATYNAVEELQERIAELEAALCAMPCTCQHPALECERCSIVREALEQKDESD